MPAEAKKQASDWAAGRKGLVLVWGLPIAAMLGATSLEANVKTGVWLLALLWMGGACLLNARRCGRTHCYFTGPFFLLMSVPVALHGFAILPLGPEGWRWLGTAVAAGGGGIWYLSEKFWGRYRT